MSKVGKVVRYTPTDAEFPMAKGNQMAAIITGWDEDTEKAELVVFPSRADYVMAKDGALEGSDPGTFQQPDASGAWTADADAAKAKAAKAEAAKQAAVKAKADADAEAKAAEKAAAAHK